MNDIKLTLRDDGKGAFAIEEDNERLAEMAISITGTHMIVYHTEVSDKLAGQGIAKKLLAEMVDYARKHTLQVIPLCPFVKAQFEKHPEQYADVWNGA
jgi:predicted GNAT family acetyltransferase